MDVVDLPLLTPSEPLDTAIQRMNKMNRRMIVVAGTPREFTVHRNRAVLAGWRDKVKTVGRLRSGERVAVLEGLGGFGRELATPNDFRALEMALDQSGASYGVLAMPLTDARIVSIITRHEGLAAEARSPTKECVCMRFDTHSEKCPPADDAGECPYCGGEWRCA